MKTAELTGQKFGMLTAEEIVGKSDNRDNIWRCRCQCGAYVTRTAVSLGVAVKNGQRSMCKECAAKDRRRIGALYRRLNRDAFKVLFLRYGSLWPIDAEESLKSRIRSDIRKSLGEYPTDHENVPTLPIFLFDNEGISSGSHAQDDGSEVYPNSDLEVSR